VTVAAQAAERAAPHRAATPQVEPLRDHVRASLRMARVLLDEVLDTRLGAADPEDFRNLAGKAGGEMAMLLRMAARALPTDGDQREIRALAADLAPLARLPQARRSLLLRPSRATMHALAHFCLTELGCPDESFDRIARLALRSSVQAANERVPYRMLDAAWTRHIAFGDAELEHPAIELSPLGAGVDLLQATDADAYAYTHALPYATDFGRLPLPAAIDRRRLLGIAEAIALRALDDDDLDLLAEVLMAPAILRLPWTPTLRFAWSVLDQAWIDYGFVPGPGLPAPPAAESRAAAARRVLGTVYHTTFAAGLCAATLAASEAAPRRLEPGPAGDIAPPPGRGAAWKAHWLRCSRATQESLRLLALGLELRRALEGPDLLRVHALAHEAARSGLIEHPLFVQAVELLERATVPT
jgi:hypothetical protein